GRSDLPVCGEGPCRADWARATRNKESCLKLLAGGLAPPVESPQRGLGCKCSAGSAARPKSLGQTCTVPWRLNKCSNIVGQECPTHTVSDASICFDHLLHLYNRDFIHSAARQVQLS